MPRGLVSMFEEFVTIFKTLRSLDEIENALKTLDEIYIPLGLANAFKLKKVIRRINTYTPFEDMKDRIIEKIEKLEDAYRRGYNQKSEEKEEPEVKKTKKTSRYEKKPATKKNEKSRKREAEASGSMEPPPKISMASKDEKPRCQPLIVTSSGIQGYRIPKKRSAPTPASGAVEKPTEAAKDVPKPVPAPLSSLKVEKPAWLSDDILAKYGFNR